jgi:hypothetical protein
MSTDVPKIFRVTVDLADLDKAAAFSASCSAPTASATLARGTTSTAAA